MKFGEKLDRLMHEHGHGHSDLARLVGTNRSSISNTIAGRQNLRHKHLLAIARLYGVSLESLVDDAMGIERLDPKESLILILVRDMGADEVLRRLSSYQPHGTQQGKTRFPWGQIERPEAPKMAEGGSETKDGSA